MSSLPPTVNRMALFDANVAALRTHVERYVERGFYEENRSDKFDVLDAPGTAATMCIRIGKALGRPWITISWRDDNAWLTMPNTAALKHLQTMLLVSGTKVDYLTNNQVVEYCLQRGGKELTVHFGPAGLELLEAWKELVQTDKACRFALRLPARLT